MVAMPDGNAQAAAVIGAVCSDMRVNTAAFISASTSSSEEAVSEDAGATAAVVADGGGGKIRGLHRGYAGGAAGVATASCAQIIYEPAL